MEKYRFHPDFEIVNNVERGTSEYYPTKDET
jgi:hypothetical protein